MSKLHYLPALLPIMPLIGLLVLLFLPKGSTRIHRIIGIVSTIPSLLLGVYLYSLFFSNHSYLSYSLDWFTVPYFEAKIQYSILLDGFSILFVLLTCIITTIAAFSSSWIKNRTKEYYILILFLQSAMTGVFLANNLILFFIFFEVTLISTFFLIGIWGFLKKERAANQFLLYNGISSAFMLFAFIALFALFHSTNLSTIQESINEVVKQKEAFSGPVQMFFWSIFLSLLIAFGIKLPVFPFHSWMLRVHTEAPIPVVMIHAGILLKMGAYGLLRFGFGLFPTFMKSIAFILAILGLINVLYGAILALRQHEFKKGLAYSSISQMGIVILGIASMNQVGIQGAIFQTISHGLISALLFYLVGILYERTGTTRLNELGGLAQSMPLFSGILLTAGMALLGLPGLSGFVSELMVFLGLFKVMPFLSAIGTLGLILSAVYTLRLIMKTSFGPITNPLNNTESDINMGERSQAFTLLGLIIILGIYPSVLSKPMYNVLQMLVSRIGG